jgi:hypothetical protein
MSAEVAKPKPMWRIVINILPEAVIIVRALAAPDNVKVTGMVVGEGCPREALNVLNFGRAQLAQRKGEGRY